MIHWSLLFGQIVPVAGPSAGGTKVTVTGENLGRGSTDTYITVGGQECIINHVDEFIRCVFSYYNHTHMIVDLMAVFHLNVSRLPSGLTVVSQLFELFPGSLICE